MSLNLCSTLPKSCHALAGQPSLSPPEAWNGHRSLQVSTLRLGAEGHAQHGSWLQMAWGLRAESHQPQGWAGPAFSSHSGCLCHGPILIFIQATALSWPQGLCTAVLSWRLPHPPSSSSGHPLLGPLRKPLPPGPGCSPLSWLGLQIC